jgi:amino acid transporter
MAQLPLTEHDGTTEYESSDRHLRKALSFQDLFFLSMSGIIGSGWLLAVLGADSKAGPAVVLSWLIGGILVLIIALNYAEISGMIPRSGAIVRYPHITHGSYTGYVLAWSYFLAAVTVPTIEAEAVVTYASSYIHGLTASAIANGSSVTVLTGLGIVFALVLTIVFFLLNYFGIKVLGRFNTIITWWKFIIPTLTFILLFFIFRASNFTNYGGFAPLGSAAIFSAIPTAGIVFAYLGFRQALDYGGEARNPQRDVPRATIISVIAATLLYVLLQLSFTGAINWSAIGIKAGDWALLGSSHWARAPFASALQSSGIALFAAFAVLLQIDAYVSPGGTGLVYTGTAARTIYGIAVDNYLPTFFMRVNQRWGIPVVALIAATLIGWLFLLPLPSWYLLVGFISAATVFTYIMGGVGLMVLRRTAKELHRPYRMPAAQVLAPLGFIAAALIVYWSGTSQLNYIVAAVIIGLPLYAWIYAPRKMGINPLSGAIAGVVMLIAVLVTGYYGLFSPNPLNFFVYFILLAVEVLLFSVYLWFASAPEQRHQITSSAWVFILIFGLYFISYFGPFGPQKQAPLVFPLDTVIAAVFSLIIFYWAVVSGHSTPEIKAIIAAQGNEAKSTDTATPAS